MSGKNDTLSAGVESQTGRSVRLAFGHRTASPRASVMTAILSLAVISAGWFTGAQAQAAPIAKGRSIKARVSADAVAPEVVALNSEAQHRLSDIGYWSNWAGAKQSEQMRFAILAFQRVQGRAQNGKLDAAELEALKTAARPTPRETGYAHIEVDLTRQVLMVVNADNTVSMTLPISSGSGKLFSEQGKTHRAVTPRGRFTVYNKIQGWRKAPLGMIYYPCYFNEGIAIHGSGSIPNYPASHGCVRIPIVTAKQLAESAPIGTTVLVYD